MNDWAVGYPDLQHGSRYHCMEWNVNRMVSFGFDLPTFSRHEG